MLLRQTAVVWLLLLFVQYHPSIATATLRGNNHAAPLPPLGWRSWNAFHGNINQQIMQDMMAAMADRSRKVNGEYKSLADIGYLHVGLDDYWQECGAGINGSFHTKTGQPIINKKLFPDMAGMVKYGKDRGLKPGWYMNNCHCHEHLKPNWPPQMHGDTHAILSFGFDGVKIDGCGPSHNLTEWYDLLNGGGHSIMIENCHDNTTFPFWMNKEKTDLNCPMNMWRVSSDIQANWRIIMSNLQHTIPFQDPTHPISQPNCWAYPDMLEVANGRLTYEESRSHFGAWCVVSSPLILGFNLSDSQKMDQVWDIITNTDALGVSQTWAGHPGRLVAKAEKTWNHLPIWEIWCKKLHSGAQACLVVNIGENKMTIKVDFTQIGFSGKVHAYDIWAHKSAGTFQGETSVDLASHDSVFWKLTAL